MNAIESRAGIIAAQIRRLYPEVVAWISLDTIEGEDAYIWIATPKEKMSEVMDAAADLVVEAWEKEMFIVPRVTQMDWRAEIALKAEEAAGEIRRRFPEVQTMVGVRAMGEEDAYIWITAPEDRLDEIRNTARNIISEVAGDGFLIVPRMKVPDGAES